MRVAIRSLPPIRWVPHRPILRTQRINRHPRIIPIRRRLLIQIRDTLCLIGNGRQGQLLLAGSVVSPLLDHHGLSEILVGGAHDGEAVDVGGRGGRVPVAGGGAGVGGVGGRAVEVGGAGHFAWTGWATFVLSSATALFTILCTCHINQEQGVNIYAQSSWREQYVISLPPPRWWPSRLLSLDGRWEMAMLMQLTLA